MRADPDLLERVPGRSFFKVDLAPFSLGDLLEGNEVSGADRLLVCKGCGRRETQQPVGLSWRKLLALSQGVNEPSEVMHECEVSERPLFIMSRHC